jgi:glycosyltransferase involved in cell wall biosynthesis
MAHAGTPRLRILVHHRIASFDGQAVHLQELTDAWRRLGHQVVVVGPPILARSERARGVAAVAAAKRVLPRVAFEIAGVAHAVLSAGRLLAVCSMRRPDVLYERLSLFQIAGWLCRRLIGCRLAVEINAPVAEEQRDHGGLVLQSLAGWCERRTLAGADLLLPVSRLLADRLVALGVPRGRMAVVPNGADPARFGALADPTAVRRRLGLDGSLVVGFLGFPRAWHGLTTLAQALVRAGDGARLLVIGDGPAVPALRRSLDEVGCGERLIVTGALRRDEVPAHLAALDIAVLPDLPAYASPLKLFEYMAAGRAIVAPRRANIQEIVDDGRTALLFDPGRPDEMAACLARLAGAPDLRRRLGDAARRDLIARGFTWSRNAERTAALFAELGSRAEPSAAFDDSRFPATRPDSPA